MKLKTGAYESGFQNEAVLMRAQSNPDRNRGVSLLELNFVILLLGVVLVSMTSFVNQVTLFSVENTQRLVVEQTGWRVVDRLKSELQAAQPDSLLPIVIDNSDFITFQSVVGFSNGAPLLSSTQIAFVLDPGEELNSIDDNDDGRTDEGYITYTQDGGAAITIASNVTGLRFSTTAGGITYSVDVATVGRDGELLQLTVSDQITFRN